MASVRVEVSHARAQVDLLVIRLHLRGFLEQSSASAVRGSSPSAFSNPLAGIPCGSVGHWPPIRAVHRAAVRSGSTAAAIARVA